MSMLKSVTQGRLSLPELIILYGPDGVGKSTFGASAPKPIFIGAEKGTANLNTSRFSNISTFADVQKGIAELTNDVHDFQSLVIDSLDWLEPLLHAKICEQWKVESIERVDGGYGKGYVVANKEWLAFTKTLSDLRERRKMNIILLAHSMVKTFQDPTQNAAYDRYQLKLNDKASALFREFVDSVFFANYEVYTKKDQDSKKSLAFGEGKRVMYTERRPAYDAKSRYSLPSQMALSWDDYIIAKTTGSPNKPEELLKNISELLAQVPDAAVKTAIEAAVKRDQNDSGKLQVTLNRLRTMLGQ